MSSSIHHTYASSEFLREKARRRVPGFAFEYLDGGCFSDVNLSRNTDQLREVELRPRYLIENPRSSLETELFGHTYSAPFGVAPIGLQGLVWPNSCEALAAAANKHNVPFILSTVGTASIETIAALTEGQAWFQLYHPADDDLRDKLLTRALEAGLTTLVVLADTPTFAYRPREMRNGLCLPPRMTLSNALQVLAHPTWSVNQLLAGLPSFATLEPYLPKRLGVLHLAEFMNSQFSGRLTPQRLAVLRDMWPGHLVVKGIVTEEDAQVALDIGADGLIVSNHGGRNLDAGESTITSLSRLARQFGDRTTLMMDSGLRSGSDVACSLASGARFTFLGRTFMYGVAALGRPGGVHTMVMLKKQLTQVLEQLGCGRASELPNRLVKAASS